MAVIIIVIVLVISVAFLFVLEPEQTRVQSLDQVVTITGLTRASQPFTVKAQESAGGAVLTGPLYLIGPSQIVLENPATIAFDISSRENAPELVIYRYDEALMMWELIESVVQRTDQTIVIEVDRFGSFSLGVLPDIEALNFFSTYDELISMAPENAVGYEQAVGFNVGDDPVIKISNTERVGGCGGLLTQGNREEQSLIQNDVRVLLDDVQTLVTFSFVARWFVSDLGGCPEGQSLAPFGNL